MSNRGFRGPSQKRTRSNDEIKTMARIQELKKTLKRKYGSQRKYRNHKRPNLLFEIAFWISVSILVLWLCPEMIVKLSYGGLNPLCDIGFGAIKMTTFVRACSSLICIPIFAIANIVSYKREKNKAQINESLIAEIEFLEEQLQKEKKHLKEIRHNRNRMNHSDREELDNDKYSMKYNKTLNRRLEIIDMLINLREELLKKKSDALIRERLRSQGLTKEEIDEAMSYAEKKFGFQKKQS